jgi:hypothetical protein
MGVKVASNQSRDGQIEVEFEKVLMAVRTFFGYAVIDIDKVKGFAVEQDIYHHTVEG